MNKFAKIQSASEMYCCKGRCKSTLSIKLLQDPVPNDDNLKVNNRFQ